jgi:hypothetical protein
MRSSPHAPQAAAQPHPTGVAVAADANRSAGTNRTGPNKLGRWPLLPFKPALASVYVTRLRVLSVDVKPLWAGLPQVGQHSARAQTQNPTHGYIWPYAHALSMYLWHTPSHSSDLRCAEQNTNQQTAASKQSCAAGNVASAGQRQPPGSQPPSQQLTG